MTLSARFALAMVFLVVVTTFALSLIKYYFVTEAVIPRGLDRLATEAALGATEIEAALNGARQDLMVIQSGVTVAQMVAARARGPVALQADAEIRESIAARFLSVLKIKPEYVQLRIIGAADGGRELVRADRGGQMARLASFPIASSRSKGNATRPGGPCRSRPLESTFLRSGSSRVASGIPPRRCFKSVAADSGSVTSVAISIT
jgi:hypothetical protein